MKKINNKEATSYGFFYKKLDKARTERFNEKGYLYQKTLPLSRRYTHVTESPSISSRRYTHLTESPSAGRIVLFLHCFGIAMHYIFCSRIRVHVQSYACTSKDK